MMKSYLPIEAICSSRSGIRTSAWRIFSATALFILIGLRPASAQNIYSDSWLSGTTYSGGEQSYDEANSSPAYIVSGGVTDGDYTHYYYVETTVQSPNGRSAYNSGGEPGSVGHASMEVALVWNENDVGDYETYSYHYSYCPYGAGGVAGEINYFLAGSSYFDLPIGVSFSCYLKQAAIFTGNSVTAKYRVIENCECSCKSETATVVFRRGPAYVPKEYLLVAEPYVITPFVGNVCGHITTWQDLNSCQVCTDVDAP